MAESDDDDRFTDDRPAAPRPRRRAEPNDDYESDRPRRSPRKAGGGSSIIWIVLGVVALLLILLCGGGGALVYFAMRGAVTSVQSAAERANSSNNLKQIGLGMHNYHDQNNKLPPPYLKTKDGKPGLSWRVILPYIEQDFLYRQFKLDEPWDSPKNLALLNQMPQTYASRPD